VFCGKGHFLSSYLFTSDYLKSYDFIEVSQCENDSLVENLADAHVVIPFMGKLTRDVIRSSTQLKLIMQFGAGLEGVDINSANECRVKVARIPSLICDNASSWYVFFNFKR
jgi:lactate dehydrogenase-like 2-hydroxyacid dehydrogenase